MVKPLFFVDNDINASKEHKLIYKLVYSTDVLVGDDYKTLGIVVFKGVPNYKYLVIIFVKGESPISDTNVFLYYLKQDSTREPPFLDTNDKFIVDFSKEDKFTVIQNYKLLLKKLFQ